MIALLVITDGRAHIGETIASARAHLIGPVSERVIYDDTGDPERAAELHARFPDFAVVQHPQGRQGFGGAIRAAWHFLQRNSRAPFVFHLEDDFTFNRPVPLVPMAHVLDSHPHIVQMALRRQPWNAEERAAGGVVEQHPDDYTEVTWRTALGNGAMTPEYRWLEHRKFFTTNPSLYRRSLCLQHWPRGAHSEGRFTHQLLASPKIRFAFWGGRDSGEAVTHIGHERAGVGY